MTNYTRVARQENTSDIARRLGVTNARLVEVNSLKPHTREPDGFVYFSSLREGEELIIPREVRALVKAALAPTGGRPAAPPPQGDVSGGYLTNGPCGPNEFQAFPGVCLPKTTTTKTLPKGPCVDDSFVEISPGVCIPRGIATPWGSNSGGKETFPNLPCPPGFTQAAPGICLPPGVPLGQTQGGCNPGEIEVVPGSGICVQQNLLGQDKPTGGGLDPSICKQYGANYSLYFDKASGEWVCGFCRDDEYMSADGFCMCKPGTDRKDPSDVNSSCVNADGVLGGGIPGKPTIEQCQQQFGPGSIPVIDPATNLWGCSACRPDEVVDPVDGKCMCRPGTHRQTAGDPDSPCVADKQTEIPDGYTKTEATSPAGCKSPNIWIEGKGCFAPPEPAPKPEEKPVVQKTDEGTSAGTIVAIVLGGLALIGTAVGLSRSASPQALPPATEGEPRRSNPARDEDVAA